MASGKLTDAPTHSWWPLQNQDVAFPSRISAAISSPLVHLVLVLTRMRTIRSRGPEVDGNCFYLGKWPTIIVLRPIKPWKNKKQVQSFI